MVSMIAVLQIRVPSRLSVALWRAKPLFNDAAALVMFDFGSFMRQGLTVAEFSSCSRLPLGGAAVGNLRLLCFPLISFVRLNVIC